MKYLLIILCFFSFAPLTYAAIARDTNAAFVLNPASGTVSYTTSGSNRYLVVGVLIQNNQTVTGVTYAGVAMTQLTSQVAGDVSTGETDYLFGLANPAIGTNNIVVTFSGTGTNGVGAVSYTGTQQTTAVEASGSNQNTGSASTQAVTTITDNDWLVGFARSGGNTTAGTNTTILGAVSNINMMDSNAPQTPPGSYSLNFTGSGGTATQVIAIKPFPSSPTIYDLITSWITWIF